MWLGIFVGRDFAYYWIHRAEHRVRVLWASHMIHHSLERFTFTSAVRLPWMEAIYKPALALWVPLIGFHPVAFAAMGALVLIAGQLQHTEPARRRPPLDRVSSPPRCIGCTTGRTPNTSTRTSARCCSSGTTSSAPSPRRRPVRYGLAGGSGCHAQPGPHRRLPGPARRRPAAQDGISAAARYLVAAP